MKIAYRYGRHSTKDPSKSTNSRARQDMVTRETFHREYKKDGYQMSHLFYDVITGTSTLGSRSSFSELMKLVEAGDIILVEEPERLSRNPEDYIEALKKLDKQGVRIIYCAGITPEVDADGLLIQRLVAATAAHKPDKTRETNIRTARVRRERGQPNGRGCSVPPLGWYFQKREGSTEYVFVKHTNERKWIDKLAAMIRDGMTLSSAHRAKDTVEWYAFRNKPKFSKRHWTRWVISRAIKARYHDYPQVSQTRLPNFPDIHAAAARISVCENG